MRKLFNKISAWLVGLKIDTYLHILATMFVAFVLARISFATGADRVLAGYGAAFVAFVVGFIKEYWDNKTTGLFDPRDILANFIGALFFFLIWI
ncbi:MAG: hypothetical protein IKD75_15565 [Prevotella sp.]|nr:hypothetical protein [Prevotella sp.]MBR4699796.1 hypothetical protein [Prevotella sp.]